MPVAKTRPWAFAFGEFGERRTKIGAVKSGQRFWLKTSSANAHIPNEENLTSVLAAIRIRRIHIVEAGRGNFRQHR